MNDDQLFLDDEDRYSRLRLIAWWDQKKLQRASVLVVGAGALGNEVLKNLALLGLGRVYIVDFDVIEQSNLTRSVLFRRSDCGSHKADSAARAMREINPDTEAIPIRANILTDIGLGMFRDVDVVIGCLDNREARLWVNRCCWKVNRPWVDGGIQEISGVVKVFVPPDSACYECAMTDNDYRLINVRYSCPLLRQEDLQAGKVPTAPTIASMIGGLQVQEALKLIHDLPVDAGKALVFNGVSNNFYPTRFQRKEDCLSHETYPDPCPLPLGADQTTARQLIDQVRQHYEWPPGEGVLELDRDLVVAIECADCKAVKPVMRARQLVGMKEARCEKCNQPGRPVMVHRVQQDSELADRTLSELGVPKYDIVRVTCGSNEQFVLLDGDRPGKPTDGDHFGPADR